MMYDTHILVGVIQRGYGFEMGSDPVESAHMARCSLCILLADMQSSIPFCHSLALCHRNRIEMVSTWEGSLMSRSDLIDMTFSFRFCT